MKLIAIYLFSILLTTSLFARKDGTCLGRSCEGPLACPIYVGGKLSVKNESGIELSLDLLENAKVLFLECNLRSTAIEPFCNGGTPVPPDVSDIEITCTGSFSAKNENLIVSMVLLAPVKVCAVQPNCELQCHQFYQATLPPYTAEAAWASSGLPYWCDQQGHYSPIGKFAIELHKTKVSVLY